MEDIFGNIYSVFENLFGVNLANYLWGYDCATSAFSNVNLFNVIGLIAVGILLFFVLTYYYGIRHLRFTGWGSWLIVMGIVGIINLFIGYGWTVNDLLNGKIGNCLVYIFDQDGQVISTQIETFHCWMFGFVNLLFSIVLFAVFSFVFKWGSKHAKYSPF